MARTLTVSCSKPQSQSHSAPAPPVASNFHQEFHLDRVLLTHCPFLGPPFPVPDSPVCLAWRIVRCF